MNAFASSLVIQAWIMYGLGALLIIARFISRYISEGSIFKMWIEEYIMLGVLVTFTADTWAIPQIAIYGSNYMSHADAIALSPHGVQRHIYGSKMTLVVEMLTLATTWACKAVLCVMFFRLTSRRQFEHRVVIFISAYCVVAYVLINILFLGYWCRPFAGYWAVPVEHAQCSTYYHHLIFAAAFNISADLMLLAVPLRLLPKLQIPLKRKMVVICVLSLGVFNILAAVLNRYYNFSHPNTLLYTRWYVGEVATSVYVVNIPACWPLLRRIFRLDSWADGQSSANRFGNTPQSKSRALRQSSTNKQLTTTEVETTSGIRGESEENLAARDALQWDARGGGLGAPSVSGMYHSSLGRSRMQDNVELNQIMKTVEVSQSHDRSHRY